MSRSKAHLRKNLFFSLFALLMGCAVVAAAAWFVSSSSALSPLSSLTTFPTPTSQPFFGYVEIAKPTYTASPAPTQTPVPTDIPTNTPEPMVYADILVDTPAPDYTASLIENPFDETAPAAPGYVGNKYILVDISEQHMYVYEGDMLKFSFVSSTGMNNATSVGNFSVLNKIPNAYGASWNIWMPNWLGIYWAGNLQNGIHALPILPNGAQLWAGYLGTPISYGCVVIGAYESQLLYDWAEIGTPVEIQW